jgi:hypothetical protein
LLEAAIGGDYKGTQGMLFYDLVMIMVTRPIALVKTQRFMHYEE